MRCLQCGHDCGDVPCCPNCDRRGGCRDPKAQPRLDAYAYARLIIKMGTNAQTHAELRTYHSWGQLAVARYPQLSTANDISFRPATNPNRGATS